MTDRGAARLFIDARMLGEGGTGVATYTRALVAAAGSLGRDCGLLHGMPARGRLARAVMAGLPGTRALHRQGSDLAAADVFRIAQAHFNLYGRVLRLRAPGPPGIMHWSYPVPLMVAGWANLYTIHDVIPLTHPALTPIAPARHRRMLGAIDRVATRWVTVSGAARDEIGRVLGWPADRVVDCGQAIVRETAADRLPDGCVAGGYLLFCGRIEARKNLARLIEAHRCSGTTLPLLLVGPVAEGGAAILAAGLRDNPGMQHMPYVPRATLLALIEQARALLLPSLAEGFGLPAAEAMTLGTPTLISRDPALIETAAGAASIVDAMDVDAMATAIARLAFDDRLCADLAERGRAQAGRFTVERFAARLGALYASVEP